MWGRGPALYKQNYYYLVNIPDIADVPAVANIPAIANVSAVAGDPATDVLPPSCWSIKTFNI
jgi:hypothetical protein